MGAIVGRVSHREHIGSKPMEHAVSSSQTNVPDTGFDEEHFPTHVLLERGEPDIGLTPCHQTLHKLPVRQSESVTGYSGSKKKTKKKTDINKQEQQ